MEKTKSIDGLVQRRSKKAPSNFEVPKTKAKTKQPTIHKTAPLTPTKKPVKSTRPKQITQKNTPTTKINQITKPSTTIDDFLKPIQAFNFDEQTGKLEASDTRAIINQNKTHKSKPSEKPKKVKKKMSKKRKIILSIIISVIFILTAGGIWLIIWGNDIIARITNGQGNFFDLLTFIDDHYEPLKTDENGRTNILAFGTSGYNMDGEEGNGTHDGAQLTDSIMVLSLNQESGDLAMLSLPRDLKTSTTCTATGKINEVYWCNNMDGTTEQAGAEALMTAVGDILGIEFQYYAHINWGSLVQIVDTLGGINVTLDEGIYDYYYTKAVYEPGVEYTLNGEEALGLARARHGTTSGDFSRGASQQKILIGIKEKLFEKQLSITDLTDLAGTLGDNLRTNFNIEEIKTVAHLTSNFDFNSIRQVSLIDPEPLMTTGTINGISYVLPVGGANYYTKIQNYITRMFSNNPSDYENATILILNATNTPGLASSEQTALTEKGFSNITIDDAPIGEYQEGNTLYSLSDTTPNTKSSLESIYQTTAQGTDSLPANIPSTYDFVIILNSISQE